jgi:hypothetical protein
MGISCDIMTKQDRNFTKENAVRDQPKMRVRKGSLNIQFIQFPGFAGHVRHHHHPLMVRPYRGEMSTAIKYVTSPEFLKIVCLCVLFGAIQFFPG